MLGQNLATDFRIRSFLLLFEEEKRDANFFGLTAPIEILSQVQKKADERQAQKSPEKGRAVLFYL